MRQLIVLLLSLVLFSHCSVLTQSYSYNNSRNEREPAPNEPRREERPLYEPMEEEEPAETEADEELALEEEDNAEAEESPGEKPASEEAALRAQVVEYAKEYLGTKYRLGGNNPQEGFDCSGFTCYVMDRAEIVLARTSQAQENDGKKIKLKNVRPGDLIFFRRSPLGKVFHVAMVVENRKDGIHVIHSTNSGVRVDNITQSSYWEPKISSARDVISQ